MWYPPIHLLSVFPFLTLLLAQNVSSLPCLLCVYVFMRACAHERSVFAHCVIMIMSVGKARRESGRVAKRGAARARATTRDTDKETDRYTHTCTHVHMHTQTQRTHAYCTQVERHCSYKCMYMHTHAGKEPSSSRHHPHIITHETEEYTHSPPPLPPHPLHVHTCISFVCRGVIWRAQLRACGV